MYCSSVILFFRILLHFYYNFPRHTNFWSALRNIWDVNYQSLFHEKWLVEIYKRTFIIFGTLTLNKCNINFFVEIVVHDSMIRNSYNIYPWGGAAVIMKCSIQHYNYSVYSLSTVSRHQLSPLSSAIMKSVQVVFTALLEKKPRVLNLNPSLVILGIGRL